MNPKHLKKVPDDRKAVAPYNFVEIPEKVVEAKLECNGKLRDNNRYYSDRHTGKIICTLKTESPLYIRCGLTPADFADFGDKQNEELTPEQRKKKAEFFQYPSKQYPVLPGSSLRGMVRTLVEIVSFGKIERVSDASKFFFRAVAADSDDPLAERYTNAVGKLAGNVSAGYLEKRDGKWFIRPAMKNHLGKSFIRVKEEDIKVYLPSLITMEKANYLPQYLKISYEGLGESLKISENCDYEHKGWLVTSGNMLDNSKTTEAERKRLLRRKEGRKSHYIVLQSDNSAVSIPISEEAIRDYRNALTDFQQGKPFKQNPKNTFDESMGFLKYLDNEEPRPVFYCKPQNRQSTVTLFGQSPNFRIPYSPKNDGKAASAVDFIPEEVGESDKIDLADAIFGFVRRKNDNKEQGSDKNKKGKREKSRAGRIFFSDAQYKTDEDGIWLTDDTITPQILATSKPTTFQHYLVQKSHEKKSLKHYASQPNQDTVIRGHKLYWHKGNVGIDRIKAKATEAEIKDKQSQYTEIKPIQSGVSFEFTIYFENLSDVELGALLWVLTLSVEDVEKVKLLGLDSKEKYRLSLGIGKPLGMGAVMIEKYELSLNERYRNEPQQRYTQLFDDNNWLSGDRPANSDEHKECIHKFEEYVTTRISEADFLQDYEKLKLKDVPRIKMLLTMLRWDIFPPVSRTRYMEIEREITTNDYICQSVKEDDKTVNEYKCRLILPTPFQVMDMSDNRRHQAPKLDNLKSYRQNEITKSKPSQEFQIGQILDAEVIKIIGIKVTYKMLADIRRTTDEHKKAKYLQEGQMVKVKITALKDNREIKNIKLLD
ncbi:MULTISPECIES: TIGR03986 family CRISPR-associated RAMP protein [unclassified Nostoc]|uniref:TIGR03986 family type III CRISPR-associated RAMP protein n=1 Tax=unclassified Nostoc TaxID=2593658 RepID=UPI002AD51C6F|nr:TIGR03986 family CRISPR-associated RAMP protein [Nostoc sp. DedQUE03]MDZ7972167.1 TIGR03986 family CRISPR-associated RAMP protein [Nostoc sp. DedQUE03]MDZ8047156.1 TIGR03986 family CRISPR-associated RAMP protein [Nostoc sp. DedQUE02]